MSSGSSGDDDYSSCSFEEDDEELNDQLRTLQSLVPNVTQTDPISILEKTRDYLRQIHEETERLEKEISAQPQLDHLIEKVGSPSSSREYQRYTASSSSPRCQILKVEIDKMGNARNFVVNIFWKRLRSGAAAEVQRAIEFCDLKVKTTSIDVTDYKNPDKMQTTACVKVKKGRNMTEKELRDLLLSRFPSFNGREIESPDMYVCLEDYSS